MSHVKSIFRAVEFIEQNLKEEIAVADMADAAYYSLFHFCRMFNKVVQQTPYDYLIKRRLTESARDLLETNKKIIEIAFDYQFNNPETFSRAFKRFFGIQPNQWKKQSNPKQNFGLPQLSYDYLNHINKGDFLKPVFEKKSRVQLAGLMTVVNNEKDISELWQLLESVLERYDMLEPAPNFYGILSYSTEWGNGVRYYFAAAEIELSKIEKTSLVFKSVPEMTYARFIHKGTRKERKWTSDFIHHTWLQKSGSNLSLPFEIEFLGKNIASNLKPDSEIAVYVPVGE